MKEKKAVRSFGQPFSLITYTFETWSGPPDRFYQKQQNDCPNEGGHDRSQDPGSPDAQGAEDPTTQEGTDDTDQDRFAQGQTNPADNRISQHTGDCTNHEPNNYGF
jgi:hypothetical protein